MFIARLDRSFRTPEECHVLRRIEINIEFNGQKNRLATRHMALLRSAECSVPHAINIALLRSEAGTDFASCSKAYRTFA